MGIQFHGNKLSSTEQYLFLFFILNVSMSLRIRPLFSSKNRVGTSVLKISTSIKDQQSLMSCFRRRGRRRLVNFSCLLFSQLLNVIFGDSMP